MSHKLIICGLLIALAGLSGGCKNTDQAPSDTSGNATSSAPAVSADSSSTANSSAPAASTSAEGVLQFEDLEGGLWRLQTAEQSWVLRSAEGCPALETAIQDANLKSGMRVTVQGHPASDEGNIGIHMAGPYFEVTDIKPIK
ncbi:hypothetical protein IJT17_00875 [bacterium]|nr:hypothetical protein [bacterium]